MLTTRQRVQLRLMPPVGAEGESVYPQRTSLGLGGHSEACGPEFCYLCGIHLVQKALFNFNLISICKALKLHIKIQIYCLFGKLEDQQLGLHSARASRWPSN